MTPAADPPPDPAGSDDADLIAYLDGELDGQAARDVEARMALDPAARSDAEAYRKTFDLLDFLPKPEPSPDFASRTLTKLKLPADPATPSRSGSVVAGPPRTRGRIAVAWVAVAVSALGIGYAAHAGLRPPTAAAPGPLPLSDLSVIERLPLYAGVDDLEFLRSLDAPDLFGGTAAIPANPGPTLIPQADLPAGTREKLIDLFRGYPAARQQQLRQLDTQ
ncbi:MAG: anti-sigma factor family protein, partial [Fimbriiglobus sp.]